MKIILLLLTLIALTSCSNDCDAQVAELTKQYQTAIQYTGGNIAAIQKLQQDYNQRLNKIYAECQ